MTKFDRKADKDRIFDIHKITAYVKLVSYRYLKIT